MFERFTESSRRVVVLAQEEARMLDHNYIGTEHLLLGLIHEGDGIAARAIESTELTLDAARAEVERIIGRGGSTPTGHIPFTPRAKMILELALREALALKKSYIGPEHILLGMIREGDGVGAQILERLAAPLPVLRSQVIELAASEPGQPGQPGQPAGAEWLPTGSQRGDAGFRRQARAVTVAQTHMLSEAAEAQWVRGQVISEFRATLASLGETLAALDQRLATIERQLGIAAASPEESAAPEESVGPEEEPPAEEDPEEEPPAEEDPEESAE
jgi:ATP-dependent Clp protease ATP-binding subunit ClpA